MKHNDTEHGAWPESPPDGWHSTRDTLHLWTQIVGKVRLRQAPWVNHSWHVPLYLTSRGLTTSPIPHGTRTFQIDFDFVAQRLNVGTSDGLAGGFGLQAQAVATFYARLMGTLETLRVPVRIRTQPSEMVDGIPFERDDVHRDYVPEYANRYWRILVQVDRVFKEFRAGYLGKCSPVHYFWGGADLAVTRFSGRPAPAHPGGFPNLPDWVAREAYSHEVSSAGFWPGGGPVASPAFYSYAWPEPDGFAAAAVSPDQAFYSPDLREFILPYEAVRGAASPDATLLGFLRSTYAAAADLGGWDRASLERSHAPGRS